MPLVSGTRLGSYEVTAAIGEGGMGAVYRAHDTRLARDVAIKVLPDAVAADRERVARFTREAQTLAALRHPHIAQVYGVEDLPSTDGEPPRQALVMEYVEGEDLSARIDRSPLPVADALALARQVAEALEAAHEKGIVHRDLKPGNIRIRPDETVCVLDFGLAKALGPDEAGGTPGAASALANSPTLTASAFAQGYGGQATELGVILGTAAYMAPEQARGKPVDKRADIWAFGCVLYEMLTGRRAFGGEDVSETLAFVLTKAPDWAALPADVPAGVRRVLERCLTRERTARIPDIAAVRYLLDDASQVATSTAPAAPTRSRLAWTLSGVGTLALAALAVPAVSHLRETPAPEPAVTRTDIVTPPTSAESAFALSPDGRALVYVVSTAGRESQLYLRRLDADEAEVLEGTEGAWAPFWKPDSRAIAFFADGSLKRLDLDGGRPHRLADAGRLTPRLSGTWSAIGEILFAGTSGGLSLVSETGVGTVREATVIAAGETAHAQPAFLPDGRRFIYAVRGELDRAGLYLADLDGSTPRKVADAARAEYVEPGWLVFRREDDLVARRFDLERAELSGDFVTLASSVGGIRSANDTFSTTASGPIAYRLASRGVRTQLTWFDRTGNVLGTLGEANSGEVMYPTIDPDGRRVAFSRVVRGNRDIYVIDVETARVQQITTDRGSDNAPVWSSDGSRLLFQSDRRGRWDLFQRAAGGLGAELPVLITDEDKIPGSWLPDGRILYHVIKRSAQRDIWMVPMDGDRPGTPRPLLDTPANEHAPQASRDGRWMAYGSDNNRLLRAVDGASEAWPFASGVRSTRWRTDGREIYYLDADGRLFAVSVVARGDRLQIGKSSDLFKPRVPTIQGSGGNQQFDVAPDGRLLINVLVDDVPPQAPITLLQNWKPPAP